MGFEIKPYVLVASKARDRKGTTVRVWHFPQLRLWMVDYKRRHVMGSIANAFLGDQLLVR